MCFYNFAFHSEYVTNATTCTSTYEGGYPGQTFAGYGCWPSGCTPGSRRDCIKTLPPIIPLTTDGTGWSNRGHDVTTSYNDPPGNTSDCNRGALYT